VINFFIGCDKHYLLQINLITITLGCSWTWQRHSLMKIMQPDHDLTFIYTCCYVVGPWFDVLTKLTQKGWIMKSSLLFG